MLCRWLVFARFVLGMAGASCAGEVSLGPITASAREGITVMDHPSIPNHPSVFHVRDDGWMGASLTFDAPRVIRSGAALRLRYALYVHAGAPPAADLQRRWEAFAALPLAQLEPAAKR